MFSISTEVLRSAVVVCHTVDIAYTAIPTASVPTTAVATNLGKPHRDGVFQVHVKDCDVSRTRLSTHISDTIRYDTIR